MARRCFDFLQQANRTARRSSSSSRACPAGLPLGADDLVAGSGAPAARLRPRPPHGDRAGPRGDPLRRAPRRNARQPDRAADPQSRLDELAAHDERRGRARRSLPGARRARRHAAAAGPRRSGRRPEVRPRDDLRDVLERASARETAARVAAGAIAARCSAAYRHRRSRATSSRSAAPRSPIRSPCASIRSRALAADDDVRCVDAAVAAAMRQRDRRRAGGRRHRRRRVRGDRARRARRASAATCSWDRKLDGRLAQALMSIPAIKAVGFGRASDRRPPARLAGPRRDPAGRRRAVAARSPVVRRPTNNAGGLEGGVTNGEDVRVTAWMKPISTLMKPLRSVDLATMAEAAGGDRAQRRVRRARGRRRRRSDGRVRARRRAAREVRRRQRRARSTPRGARSRPRSPQRLTPRPEPRLMLRPDRPLRRAGPARAGRARHDVRRDARPAHRRHGRHDVRRARHRPGRAADRRAAARLRHRSQRRQARRRAAHARQSRSSSSATACSSRKKAA